MSRQGMPIRIERRTRRNRKEEPDVVIWEADGQPLPRLGHGARLAQALGALDATVTVVPYRRRALTEAELAAPVHVLSGGETSSFSPDPTTGRALRDLTEVLQRAWHADTTVIGVCLGAQLVARALNPELPRSAPHGGMEAGLLAVAGPTGTQFVAQLHYEQIHPAFAELDGVEVTHTNSHSPIQGFRWGRTVFGYQFHPEWDLGDLSTTLRRHRRLLTARGADPRAAQASVAAGAPSWSPRTLDDLVVAPAAAALEATDVTAA